VRRIFSTDHKVIGKQFLFLGLAFLAVGGVMAMLIRWQLARPGQPVPIVGRLNSELVKAAHDAAYQKQMVTLGVEAISSTPQEFGAFIESEVAKWGRAIRQSGARVE